MMHAPIDHAVEFDLQSHHDGINDGAPPVGYGQGRPPRGDYHRAKSDYTYDQVYAQYTPEEHIRYERLYLRQLAQVPRYACEAFLQALDQLKLLGNAHQIPDFSQVNESLYAATRWQIVAVPGLIPEEAFFSLLAQRKFPVTDWLRTESEFDYIVEPDLFHDFFGHVPLLFNPVFADYMQQYGQQGLDAQQYGCCELLSRLYWYTVEFGLIREVSGLRVYGAGILSSPSELRYSIESDTPIRPNFDLMTVMRSLYHIDHFQDKYFVIDSYEQLFKATSGDLKACYDEVQQLPTLAPNAV